MKSKLTTRDAWVPLFVFCIALACQGCSGIFKQTTVIYGTVTDNRGLPVEGIDIMVYGRQISHERHMATVRTDSSGHYEVSVEVTGKFHTVDCQISLNSLYDKFGLTIDGYDTYSDGKERRCCKVEIGEKTNLDFQLKLK